MFIRKNMPSRNNRTFQSRFTLYCWCADWYVGQASREYRLLCRLQYWLSAHFESYTLWQKYYDWNYQETRSTENYKKLVAKYIDISDKSPVEKDAASELFRVLKQTGHAAVRYCNWTLDLQEIKSYPPHGLRGYCSTTYQDYDPDSEDDLLYICRDFVRMASYSCRHQEGEISTEFITAPNVEEL